MFSKFLKGSLLCLGLITVLTGCGKEENGANPSSNLSRLASQSSGSIYGLWGNFPTIKLDDNNSIKFVVGYEPGKMTVFNRCTYSDHSTLVAEVSASISVTNDRITVPQPAEHTARDGKKTCTVKIHSGSYNYSVQGDAMTYEKDGDKVTLHRLSSNYKL